MTWPSSRKRTSGTFDFGYEISADGKKMIIAKDRAYGIIDLPKGPVTIETKLDLSGMEVALDLPPGMGPDL